MARDVQRPDIIDVTTPGPARRPRAVPSRGPGPAEGPARRLLDRPGGAGRRPGRHRRRPGHQGHLDRPDHPAGRAPGPHRDRPGAGRPRHRPGVAALGRGAPAGGGRGRAAGAVAVLARPGGHRQPSAPVPPGAARAELRASMGGGQLQVGSGAAGLYASELSGPGRPSAQVTTAADLAVLDLRSPSQRGVLARNRGNDWRVQLNTSLDWQLDVSAGAVTADLDLRDLALAPGHLPVGRLPAGRPPGRPGRRGPGRPPALDRPGRPLPAGDGHRRGPGRRPQRRTTSATPA